MEFLIALVGAMYITALLLLLGDDEDFQVWIDATAMMVSAIVGLALMLAWGTEEMSSFLTGYSAGMLLGFVCRKYVFNIDYYEILE